MEIGIDTLGPDEPVDGYAGAIARAFLHYPVMTRAFADHPDTRFDWIHRLVTESAKERLVKGVPIPVARFGDRIVGGANIMLPSNEPPSRGNWFEPFLRDAGPTTADFFPRFIEAVDTIELPDPHVHLLMLGVDPEFQGHGIGKRLIESVMTIAAGVEGCVGVALDTEVPGNVDIYRACGFKVVGETSLDDMPIWVMWRGLK